MDDEAMDDGEDLSPEDLGMFKLYFSVIPLTLFGKNN